MYTEAKRVVAYLALVSSVGKLHFSLIFSNNWLGECLWDIPSYLTGKIKQK